MSTLDSGIRKRLASCPDTARPASRSHGRWPLSLSLPLPLLPRTAEPAAAGRPTPDAHPHVD
ncbi:hypothetical protein G3N57_17515 [Paraburkholderia sp. Se-20369]|nr:hypothetical protein [Paraburkholderia sp. Se-20369]